MRYIALTLLLLNLAYLAWNFWQRSQTEVPVVLIETEEPGARLRLLSERETDAERAAPVAAEAAALCSRLGEFPSVEDANLFIKEARALNLQAELWVDGSLLAPQYRVYLPPYSSREIAALSLNALQEDPRVTELALETYLITRGELANGIGLGIFAERNTAETLMEALSGLGYEVRLGEVPRAEGRIFVLLSEAQIMALDPQIRAQLMLDRPYLDASENVC